jgi:hypothetical protein
MIDIEIKLNPYGQDLECTPIGRILIANTGKWEDKTLPPTHSKHNYYNYVCVLGDGTFRVVRRHDRAESIYALLARCLAVEAKVEVSFLTKVEKDTITRLLERLD